MIVFQLQDEEYAVPVNQIGSIERQQPITRVPQTLPYVKGVINLRGVVIPIIDLRLRFGMEETDFDANKRIIIAQINEMEVGLIVDVANDVIDIPEELIEPAPEVIGTVNADYIEGVAKVDNRLLILLDLQKVLSFQDIDVLNAVEG
ncbi:chemotaxis protein CheW [Oceanobacillus profundus]|uniref:Chemotaxis protein CheW n=2 Tax=Bacillaceae TaxID=186817 RepID=A0A417YKX7_9BACI|nr:chemotaxis protein CheW [Oceanobacillus profundus]MBR3121559.1 chemotaxis protein CheW [Oceanobacillus sp.]PAE30090.1 chemotaxis protein CheW [Paenibacillus sp. 7884-2]MCM3396373.1 chemotaxis protein CheW [Oceanobacillus profundus]MDO6449617.1 chemotaxis protein CheW [Oceanobacillus profundus]RHW33861.1 chemotaxis protein CheW [Oceanobacillus profundus]